MENINDDFSVLNRLTDIKRAMRNLPTTAKDTEFLFFFKWEDTIKSITQVYLQQIRIKKNTSNYKKQAKQSHAYYY